MLTKQITLPKYQRKPLTVFFITFISLVSTVSHADLITVPQTIKTSSCDIYKYITPDSPPSAVEELNQTPNGMEVHSVDFISQVKRFQLCKADKPFSTSDELISFHIALAKELDSIIDNDLGDIPESTYNNINRITSKYSNRSNMIDESNFANLYLLMASQYYLGEFLPKNDFKVVQYLNKYVESIQDRPYGSDDLLVYALGRSFYDSKNEVSFNNPIRTQLTELMSGIATYVLLSKAGHLNSQAFLLNQEIGYVDTNNSEISEVERQAYLIPMLLKLEKLGNQGSSEAIKYLSNYYANLAKNDIRYQEQANYWQTREDELPTYTSNWH